MGKVAILRLGAYVHTKARREQVAYIYAEEDPNAYRLLVQLVEVVPIGSRLFDFSYSRYNKFLADCITYFNIDVKYTGHSARAGFASERVARGESEIEVQRRGRWQSPSSFAIYVDVVTAASIDIAFKLAGLQQAMIYCHVHLLDYFSLPALRRSTLKDGRSCVSLGSKGISQEETLGDALPSSRGRQGLPGEGGAASHKAGGHGHLPWDSSEAANSSGGPAERSIMPDLLGPSAAALRAAGNSAGRAVGLDAASSIQQAELGAGQSRSEGSGSAGKSRDISGEQGSKGSSKTGRSIRPPQKR